MDREAQRLTARRALSHVSPARHRVPIGLGVSRLTLLGLVAMLGLGLFFAVPHQAAEMAGPAVVGSLLLTAVILIPVALCHAELASTLPCPGSAYTFSHLLFGRTWAWVVGWMTLLQTVLLGGAIAQLAGAHLSQALSGLGQGSGVLDRYADLGPGLDLPAAVLVLLIGLLVAAGLRLSSPVIGLVGLVKILALVVVVGVGVGLVSVGRYSPPLPSATGDVAGGLRPLDLVVDTGAFGTWGLVAASAGLLVAFLGFEAISGAAGAIRDPERSVPQAILNSLMLATLLQVLVALVVVGLRPARQLTGETPVPEAIAAAGGSSWQAGAVAAAAWVCLVGSLVFWVVFAARLLSAMSDERLLPAAIGGRRAGVPRRAYVVAGVVLALAALAPFALALLPLALAAALVVWASGAVGVLVARRTRPEQERGFRVPGAPVVAVLALLGLLFWAALLPVQVWLWAVAWLGFGLFCYLVGGQNALSATDESAGGAQGDQKAAGGKAAQVAPAARVDALYPPERLDTFTAAESDSSAPAAPIQPVQTVQPVPAQPAQSVQPVQPVQPVAPPVPVTATVQAPTLPPVPTAHSTRPARQAPTARPVHPTPPTPPAAPARSERPLEPTGATNPRTTGFAGADDPLFGPAPVGAVIEPTPHERVAQLARLMQEQEAAAARPSEPYEQYERRESSGAARTGSSGYAAAGRHCAPTPADEETQGYAFTWTKVTSRSSGRQRSISVVPRPREPRVPTEEPRDLRMPDPLSDPLPAYEVPDREDPLTGFWYDPRQL